MTAMRSSLPARPRAWAALVPALVIGAMALTGCSATNPITTQKPYSASDGVRVDLGHDLTAANLLVLTSAQGSAGTLLGALTNAGKASESVTVGVNGGSAITVTVRAGETVLLSPTTTSTPAPGFTHQDVPISAVSAAPGALLTVTLSSGTTGTQTVSVPVLDGTLPEYSALVPTA